MNNPTLSFICASNDTKVLNEMLVASLNKQKNQDFELIVIDAKEKGFKSAAEPLNYGASISKGKYLCFLHQDIELLKEDTVDQIIKYFDEYDFGIAGVAGEIGATRKEFSVVSSVIHGKNRINAGKKITDVTEVYAVDECMRFIKKDQFREFDDYGVCWHFYGVEYSLRCYEHHNKILVFPIEIYHKSAGEINNSYWKKLKLVGKKHKQVKVIKTCCGNFNNNFLLPLYCDAHMLKRKLQGKK